MADQTAVTELIIDAGAALTAAQQYDAVLDQVTDASQKAATATDQLAASITTTGDVVDASRSQISQQAKALDQYRASTDDTYTAQQKLQAGTAALTAAQQALIREVQADAISMEQYAQQTAAITVRQQELQAASAGLKDGTVDVASAMTTLQAPLQRAAAAARDQTVAHTNLASAAQALRDKIDPAAASQRNYATAVKSANDLLAATEITQTEYTAAVALAKTELEAFSTSSGHGAVNSTSLREALVLVHETLSGNYKRAVGSATIELQSLFGAQALIATLTNPLVIGAAAIAAGFIAVAVATEQVTTSQRAVTLALAATGDASGVSASAADALVSQFMAAGDVTAKEARSIEADFAKVGIAGTVWGQIVPSIKAYADVTGTDLVKAQSDLASKFADPVKGAQQLDATLHLLSDSQLQDIKNLSAQGDAMGAQGILADALNVRLHGLADDGLSGLDKVLHTVSASWSSFWDALGGGGKAGTLQGQIDTAAAALAQARGTIPQLAPNPSGSVVGAIALQNVANTPGGGFVAEAEADTTLSDLQEIQRKQTLVAAYQAVNAAMLAEGKAAGDLERSLDPVGTKTTEINNSEILLNKAFNDGVISSTAYVRSMDALVRQQSNLDPVNAMTRAIEAQGRVLAQPLGLAQTQQAAVEQAQSQQGTTPLTAQQDQAARDGVSQQQVDLLKNFNDQQTLRAAEDAVVAKAAGGTAEAQAAASNQVTLADKALAAYGLTTAQAVLAGAPLPPLLTATGAALAGISTEKFAGDLAKATTQATLHADAETRLADAAGKGDAAVRAATAANDLEAASHTSVAAVISTTIDLRTREANAITAASNATIGALNIETTSNNDMAAAVLKGNDAVVAAQLEEFKLTEQRKLGTDALVAGTTAQAAYNADLAAFVANQASAGNLDISGKLAQQKQQIDLLTQENALTDVNAQQRAVLVARAQALSDIEHGTVQVSQDQKQAYVDQAGQLVVLQQQAQLVQQADQARLQTAKQATNDLVKFGSETIDTFLTHTSGGWKALWDSMKTYAIKAFSDLAAEIALRPIVTSLVYNILGVNAPGGAGQAQGAAALLGGSSGGGSLLSSGGSLLSLGSGANTLSGGSIYSGASSAFDGAAASAFPSLFGAGGIGGSALGDSIAAEGGFGAEIGGGVAGSGTSAASGALGASATGAIGTAGAFVAPAVVGYQLGAYFAAQNSGSKVPGALEGAGAGAAAGAAIGSIVPVLGTAIGAIIGGAAGALAGLLTPGYSVGPNTAANFKLNAGTGTYGINEARSDNGASDSTSEALGSAVTQAINTFTGELGAKITTTNAGVAQIGTMGGNYFSTVNGIEGNFSDATSAVQDFVVRALKAADYSGIGTDVATAIEHSTATTVDGLMADAKFGQDFQQTLTDFRGGNDATTQSIQQAQASIDATFADIKTFRDTTAALGLSVTDANSATDAYIQNLLDLKTVVPDSAFQTAIKTTTAEFAEMQSQMIALGYSAPEASARVTTALNAAIQSIKDTYAAAYDTAVRSANGTSYIDTLSGITASYKATAADVMESGRDPNQLYDAQLSAAINQLDAGQLQNVISFFQNLDPVITQFATAALANLNQLQAASYDASLRSANGQGYIDDLLGIRTNSQATAAQDTAAGRDPTALYDAQLNQSLSGLDATQLQAVITFFQNLDPEIAKLASEDLNTALAATDAANTLAATNANQQTTIQYYNAMADAAGNAGNSALQASYQLQSALATFDINAATTVQTVTAAGGDVVFAEQTLAQQRQNIIDASNAAIIKSTQDAANAIISSGQSIDQYLDKLNATPTGGLSGADQLANAQTQYNQQLALAKGNDPTALANITQYADQLIAAAQAQYASTAQTQDIIDYVKSSLGSLPATETYQQQVITTLTSIATNGTATNALLGIMNADTNNDGEITRNEFTTWAATNVSQTTALAQALGLSNTNLDGIYSKLDLNGDGQVSAAEIQQALLNGILGTTTAGTAATNTAAGAANQNSAVNSSKLDAQTAVLTGLSQINTSTSSLTATVHGDLTYLNNSLFPQLVSANQIAATNGANSFNQLELVPAALALINTNTYNGLALLHSDMSAANQISGAGFTMLQLTLTGLPHAGGGAASGMTMINDAGPEIVRLPAGSNVMTHAASMDFLRRGAGSGGGVGLASSNDNDMAALVAEVRALRAQVAQMQGAVVDAVQEGDGTADQVRGLRTDVRGAAPPVGRRTGTRS